MKVVQLRVAIDICCCLPLIGQNVDDDDDGGNCLRTADKAIESKLYRHKTTWGIKGGDGRLQYYIKDTAKYIRFVYLYITKTMLKNENHQQLKNQRTDKR